MAQIIYFAWVFGIDRGWKEIHNGAAIQIPTFVKIIMKYIAPAYLLIVFIGFNVQSFAAELKNATSTVGARVALVTIGALLAYLVIVTFMGEKRLRAAGADIDDNTPAD